MGEVVQFREDEEKLANLRRMGVNPNEFGREAFARAYGKLLAGESAKRLEAASRRGDKKPRSTPTKLAREARTELERRRR